MLETKLRLPTDYPLPLYSRHSIQDPYADYVVLDMAFNIGTGSKLIDGSKYGAHGDITTASWAAGLHHRCLDFNSATPDYVSIPASYTQLDFTTEDFSFVMRLKPDSLANSPMILAKGTYNVSGYELYILSTGVIDFYGSQLGAVQRTHSSGGIVSAASWYTVGLSRSGENVRLYANGVDVTSVAGTHLDLASSTTVQSICVATNLTSSPFDGKMEFLRIFGGIALPASTHLAWHNALK